MCWWICEFAQLKEGRNELCENQLSMTTRPGLPYSLNIKYAQINLAQSLPSRQAMMLSVKSRVCHPPFCIFDRGMVSILGLNGRLRSRMSTCMPNFFWSTREDCLKECLDWRWRSTRSTYSVGWTPVRLNTSMSSLPNRPVSREEIL